MRRHLRHLSSLGLASTLLLAALACDTSLPVPPPDLRNKAVAAVQPRFDAHSARVETRKGKELYEVTLWMRDPATGKEKVAAICWFDLRQQLVMVRYPE